MDNVYFQPTNLGVYKYGRRRFLRRQFDDVPTQAQFNFDVAFGLIIPVLCFVSDPIVFRGGFLHEGGAFQSVRLFAYTACGVRGPGRLRRSGLLTWEATARSRGTLSRRARRCGALIVGP